MMSIIGFALKLELLVPKGLVVAEGLSRRLTTEAAWVESQVS
jgi:hypothetical protein